MEQREQRVRARQAAGMGETAIAATVKREGFPTSQGGSFNGRAVRSLQRQGGLPPVATLSSVTLVDTERIGTAEEAAQRIGVYATTIYNTESS